MQRTLFILLIGLVTLVYALFHYGGIRTPDAEIAFRTTQSIVLTGDSNVAPLDTWPDFGVSRGVDDKWYSNFGGGHALFSVPFFTLAISLNHLIPLESWRPPVSIYIDRYSWSNREMTDPTVHRLRFWMSFQNLFWTGLGVVVFYRIALRFADHSVSAWWTAMWYGLGSLAWGYASTGLSEPMATTMVLGSLHLILPDQRWNSEAMMASGIGVWRSCLAGLLLGVASTVHVTATLFLPFFAFLLVARFMKSWSRRDFMQLPWRAVFTWTIGVCLPLMCLLYYNHVRFGDPLETGRMVDPQVALKNGYGSFASPWEGLNGLLFSPGKSFLIYCPAVLLAVGAWRGFHRRFPKVSFILLGCCLFRILFIACRSDWHSGFCVGPRYLLMIVPFLLLPLVCLWDRVMHSKNRLGYTLLCGSFMLCVLQQLYFNLGEFYSYYVYVTGFFADQGINVFEGNLLYFNPQIALFPHLHVYQTKMGPFWLRDEPFQLIQWWMILGAAAVLIIGSLATMIWKYQIGMKKED